MRISKEPEARKQEILETAMKLFAEKGYEKTSISDIAKEIGVAQGLCYRYFPSKDILFQTAVNEYANILVDKIKNKHQYRTGFHKGYFKSYGSIIRKHK